MHPPADVLLLQREVTFAEIPFIKPAVKNVVGSANSGDGNVEHGDGERGTPGYDVVLHDWAGRYTNLPRYRDGSERFRDQWGAAVYAVSKRQMNRREIRRLKKNAEGSDRNDG